MTAKVAKNSNRGSKPGERRGGRKKGTTNRKTAELVASAKAGGEMPLDFLLGVMRDTEATREIRLYAAKHAAPYVHPRLASIEHAGKDGTPLRVELVRFSDAGDAPA